MNIDHNILTIITFTPLAGAILLVLLPDRGKLMQWGALAVTLITFGLTLHLPFHYDYGAATGTFQFEQMIPWVSSPAINYHLGVDGLSMWLIVLTGFLAPLGVLISWHVVDERKKIFYTLFLLQQVAMLGVFVSLDLFLYYAFWELTLVPMTILIATFGRTENRRRAAIKFFLYAFIPSAILLIGVLWLYVNTGTFDMPKLAALAASHGISSNSAALWLASLSFLVAFAVKVPVFPLHGWLADAVAEAPTAVVMVLAGKLGLYSILRFSFGIFPAESQRIAPLMIALGAIGIVYGALIALVQKDLKTACRVWHARARQCGDPRHLHLHDCRPGWRHLPDTERRHRRSSAVYVAGPALRAIWHLRHAGVWWSGCAASVGGDDVCYYGALGRWAADAQRVRR